MFTTFTAAAGQMLVLFIFMALGYILRKKDLVTADASKTLSALEVYVFLPCVNIQNFAANCTPSALGAQLWYVLAAAVLLCAVLPTAVLLGRKLGRTQMEKDVYTYSLAFSNSGYIGYPVVQAVFGEQALFSMMFFCLLINLAIYTWGMYILNPDKTFSLKKLLNPTTITPFIGIAIGLSGLALPTQLTTVLNMGNSCMAPVAMLLTGIVLGAHPLKEMFKTGRGYVAALLRLVVIPSAVAGIALLLHISGDILLIMCATLAMPMGLNSVVFPEAFGGDSTPGAQSVFLSNLMGLITIPFMLTLFRFLC